MRTGLVTLGLIVLLHTGAAAACGIENKQEIEVGVSSGVAGECSNNGSAVQCVGDGDEADSLTCDGPEGSYSGSDLQQLITAACGCAAGQDDGAAAQIQQELDASGDQ